MTNEAIQTVVIVVTGLGALVMATATTVTTIFTQAKKNRSEFWDGITALHNTVTSKLDNHEKDDDRRFERLSEQLWGIQIRNAEKDGRHSPPSPLSLSE